MLTLFKKKQTDEDIKLLLPELPFYGKGGSICRIIDAPESYYKVLYTSNGGISNTLIPVPKNKGRNFKLILNDYCCDLKSYLDEFQNQYLEYESTKIKKKLSNKQFYILASIVAICTIISIPVLLTTSWIGLVFSSVSAFSLYMICDIRNKDVTNENTRKNFIRQYNNYQRALANYKSSNPVYKERYEKTLYPEIPKKDTSYLRFIPKILRGELTKEAV